MDSRKTLWTKCRLLCMHVLEMVGLKWHLPFVCRLKLYCLSPLAGIEALIVVLFVAFDLSGRKSVGISARCGSQIAITL